MADFFHGSATLNSQLKGANMFLPTILAQMDNGGAGILAGGVFFIIWLLVVAAAFALFLWALIDAIKNPNLSDTERIVWILVIVFVGCIGPILYLLIGRNKTPPRTGGGSNEPVV